MDWLGNNVKTFKVKGITIIANRNNGMVIGLDREGEEVVDLLKSNLIEISSLSDNQKELYKVLEENDFLKSCYKEIKGIDSVYLHVNSACNLHCLGCYSYVENRNTRNELSFDEWKCVIDDLSLLGVKNIVISGGEPFLRKDLREICKYIKETVNGSLEVISNGTMNISDYEVVLPYIDALNISIDGYDDKTSFIRDPIIIDAETILDNRRRGRTNSAKEEINYILHESVLYSGLLPHYRFSNLGQGVDMSAIKGSEGKEYPIVIPKIADLCTSNMRFVYEHPTTGVNQNLVKLDGENVSAFHYLKEINAGFEDAYKYVLENKEKFLEYADMFGNLNIRHLVQDTQRYSMLLHTSFHPDFMQDGRDRQMFLCSLFKQYEATQGDKGVVKCEIKDMLNMDIPYFYLNTSGKSLFGSEGEKIEDYFEYTSLEHLKKKIVLLDEDDLKRQLMFMNIILTEINEFQVEDKKIELQQMKMIPHREKNKAHLLKAVQKLADSLIKTAVFNKDRTEVNWIGVTLIGNEDDCSWDIRPLGTYLYEGMSGLAIFFNALYAVDPQKEYLIIRNAIEKELFTYTDEMCERNEGIENESSGAFGGEASIMYTYEVLYKITNKEKYLDYAKKHYKILKKAITRDNSFDLVYGNAGAVITLINMYQLTGNKEYIASAEIAGDIIVNAQEKEGSIKGGWNGDGRTSPLAGFSHGASGIVLALAKLWQVTQKEEYLLSLLDGIKFENSLFVKEKGNWKDERVYAGEKASDGGSFTVAWCHGAAGILLSRSKVNVILNGRYSDLIENDIKVAVNTILKEGILGNNCLCHGNLGNTEILFEYLKDHSDKKIEKYYVDIRDIIAENVCNGVFDCDNAYLYGYKLQGFMTGLCGMGYSLLRDIKKDLPCVIALEV